MLFVLNLSRSVDIEALKRKYEAELERWRDELEDKVQ